MKANSTTPTFRHAETSDLDEIMQLYRILVGTPFCTWNEEYPSRELISEDIRARHLYCLCDNERILAVSAACVIHELDPLPWDARIKNPCDIARIGVLPAMQHRGIGSMMLRNIIEEIRRSGYDGIRLLVAKANIPALRMYEKAGFSICGETFAYHVDWFCQFQILE